MRGKIKLSLHTMFSGDMMKEKKMEQSLPMATLTSVSFVEIRGRNTVGIENHCGITQYSPERICLRVKRGQISVEGSDLRIVRMDHRRIDIVGQLERVELI